MSGHVARMRVDPALCEKILIAVEADPMAGTGQFIRPSIDRYDQTTPDRSAFEFAPVAFHLACQYPAAKTIHVVMDNLNIHCRKSLTNLYGAELGGQIWDRFTAS